MSVVKCRHCSTLVPGTTCPNCALALTPEQLEEQKAAVKQLPVVEFDEGNEALGHLSRPPQIIGTAAET